MTHKPKRCIPVLFLALILVTGCTRVTLKPVAILVIGEVTVQNAIGSIRTLQAGDLLKEGDEITTGKQSHAAIQIDDTIIVKIDKNTTASISRITEGKEHEVFLKSGKVFSKIRRMKSGMEYRVKTPSITAAVRGTQFSVSVIKDTQKVAVAEGTVRVNREAVAGVEGMKHDTTAGTTLVITEEVKERPISKKEKLEIEKVTIVPFIESIESLKDEKLNRTTQDYIEKYDEIEKKLKIKDVPRTLNEVKERYGRIDEISLYNGKVYRGVILKRGASFTILTPGGTVTVPKTKIKSTRVIR